MVADTGVTPAINQVELQPCFQQAPLRRVHEELGIGDGGVEPPAQGRVLDDPVITQAAAAHSRTPAQVVIRWHVQLGNVVIPKSVTRARIAENFDVFGFELTDAEMDAIRALDAGRRDGPDPETFVRP